jgi:hypothetical protein
MKGGMGLKECACLEEVTHRLPFFELAFFRLHFSSAFTFQAPLQTNGIRRA